VRTAVVSSAGAGDSAPEKKRIRRCPAGVRSLAPGRRSAPGAPRWSRRARHIVQ